MPSHSLAAVVALLAVAGLSHAWAQAPAASAPAGGLAAPVVTYRSAFEGYRRFSAQPVAPWRASNDLVARIGGWQAYARESAGEGAASGTVQVTEPAASAASAVAPIGHQGQHNDKQP